MEVWIKDVWKNSKCDLDNKRYFKKKINFFEWKLLKVFEIVEIEYYVIYVL